MKQFYTYIYIIFYTYYTLVTWINKKYVQVISGNNLTSKIIKCVSLWRFDPDSLHGSGEAGPQSGNQHADVSGLLPVSEAVNRLTASDTGSLAKLSPASTPSPEEGGGS